MGDTWTVDGQWSLTVDSIEVTDERNEFDESNPEQVVYIKYHYENLGWEDEDGLMDGLFIISFAGWMSSVLLTTGELIVIMH